MADSSEPARKAQAARMRAKARADLIRKYLADKKVMVADPNQSARAGLSQVLVELGARGGNVVLAGSFEQAEAIIDASPPDVMICDYDFGVESGLSLIQRMREKSPQPDACLAILATANANQTSVAEAAEEEVNGYLLKPFTAEVLSSYLTRAVLHKIKPSPYHEQIEKAKHLLALEKLDEARHVLKRAVEMHPRPSLAYYYLGRGAEKMEQLRLAEAEYKTGLTYAEFHYKCLAGLFDLYNRMERFEDAYATVKTINEHFPLSPQRLERILKLAVQTENFEDIQGYYDFFVSLDHRSLVLTRTMVAALTVAGKHFLKQGALPQAFDLFHKAGVTSGWRAFVLKEIVKALIEQNQLDDAASYMEQFQPEDRQGPDWAILNLLLADRRPGANAMEIVELGRRMLNENVADPMLYEALIRRSLELKKSDMAENYAYTAAKLWPQDKDRFYTLAKLS